MKAQRSLAIVLALSLVLSALPAVAAPVEAEPVEAAPVLSGTPLRGSIDRALVGALPQVREGSGSARALQASGTGSGGGGGSRTVKILLGLAVSAATTYLVMKEVNKTTEPVPPTEVTFGVTIRAGR